MRSLISLTLSFFLLSLVACGQTINEPRKANIDSIALLNSLIKRLGVNNENSHPVASIISYKDYAIPSLTNFLDTCKNKEGKYQAIYSLYLIGINSQVPYSGGYYEKFVDKNARIAMLRYIGDKLLTEAVVELLLGDPWITDTPVFINYLSKPSSNYIVILDALKKYQFQGSPLVQKVPKDIEERKIEVKTTNPDSTAENGQITVIYSNNRIRQTFDLIAIKNLNDPNFVIDDEILKSRHWIESLNNLKLRKPFIRNETLRNIYSNYYTLPSESSDNAYFYNFTGEKLHVYGPIKAREIWLDWWAHLSKEEKVRFYQNNSPSLFKSQN